MKTLVSTGSNLVVNVSRFLVDDTFNIDISGPEIVVGTMKIMAGGNWPPSQAVIHQNVTETVDGVEVLKGTSIAVTAWIDSKYRYDGSSWSANPSYVEPEE